MLTLVPAINSCHYLFLYDVRSNPEIDKYLTGKPPINYSEHLKWVKSHQFNSKLIFIIYSNPAFTPVGYCHLTFAKNEIELGWAILPKYQGQGYGRAAINALTNIANTFNAHQNGVSQNKIILYVKNDNDKAIHLYQACGYKPVLSDENVIKMQYMI